MDSELSSQISSGDRAHFLSLSPSLLVVVGADGYIRRLNLVAEQLLGWQRSELLSKPFMAFVHPEDRAVTDRAIDQAINGGPPMVFRNRYRRLDGSWQPLEWTVGEAQPTDSGPIVYCLARNMAPQQRVEQTLERSERRFRAIFDQTFQFMGLLKPDGTLLEANETALAFSDVTADRVVGKPLWHTPWWQTSEPVKQRLRDAIAKAARGEFVRYEVDILGAGSGTVTIDFSIKPLRNDAGEVILLISEGRDITERKAAELKFQELNAKLEARVARRTADIKLYAEAVENMQDGFHLWHLENLDDARSFRLQLANPAAAQLLAVDDTWALGKSMDEILPNLADTPIPDLCRQAVVTGKKRDLGAIDYVTPTGGHRTLSVRIFPLLEQCLGILFEDVTEQRRFEQQLTAQKEQLKTIFDQAGVGIARLALDGQWIEANDKLCEILGYAKAELLQTDFQSITYPDDAAQDAEHYQALLAGKVKTVSIEKRYVRKGGEPVWCSVTASIVQDNGGYFIAFIGDITERKTYELRLQRQKDELALGNLMLSRATASLELRNRELDEFAYVASHDLKAPLRAIANLAAWLEEDLDDRLPPENKQQLDLLQGRVHRMEKLIDGLLAYSRVGRSKQLSEPVDLNLLLQNVVDLLDPPPEFTVAIAANLPTLPAARPALFQVFGNLIGNAIKHHDRTDGRVEVRHQLLADGFHEFSVIDDGPGIDPAFHQKIFSMFQVLEARDKVENTGIGLSIVKKTVEAEGGAISLDSKGGQGCTFRFTWPQAK